MENINLPSTVVGAFDHQLEREHLAKRAQHILNMATEYGASDVSVTLSTGNSLDISVRNQDIDLLTHNRQQMVSLTLWHGHRKGSATTSVMTDAGLKTIVETANMMARYGAEDPASALPENRDAIKTDDDLLLYAPWNIEPEEAVKLSLDIEASTNAADSDRCRCEGAGVSSWHGQFLQADTRGFLNGFPSSIHTLWSSALAQNNNGRNLDGWHHSARHAGDLDPALLIGTKAAQRASALLNTRKLSTRRCQVLFDASVAPSLLDSLINALSGGSLWQGTSYLGKCLGESILPNTVTLQEDPFKIKGLSSRYFDSEGISGKTRPIIQNGEVAGYFLATYTARKLSMESTGNASGPYNLSLSNSAHGTTQTLEDRLRQMDKGLWVTGLLGDGLNPVTGDYSQGVQGFWIEGGKICFPVDEVTVSGNLKTLFRNQLDVGNDRVIQGGWDCGSLLFSDMQLAGN